MKQANKRISPERITSLSQCEIFVFGSNLQGQHSGGAARFAYEHFGAEWGVGVGPTGRCYAIPTMQGGVKTIRPYVEQFIAYAKEHPNNRFLLTRIGCGIAGFDDEDIAPLFEDVDELPNVAVPEEWVPYVASLYEKEKPKVEFPKVLSETILCDLCEKYRYQIGAGIRTNLPAITIRYVEEEGKFKYKKFGDFAFLGKYLYVWDTDDYYKEDHNQDVTEGIFEDECIDRGYFHRVLFAGVETELRDCNGRIIYTGDVLNLSYDNCVEYTVAISSIGDEMLFADEYGFMLDNHELLMSETKEQGLKATRVGTIFFQLDFNEEALSLSYKARVFNCNMNEKEHFMARYTPSFYQEYWKYQGLETLGVEYN